MTLEATPPRDHPAAVLARRGSCGSTGRYQARGRSRIQSTPTLCELLGARSVDVTDVEDSVSNRRIEIGGSGGRGLLGGAASGSSNTLERFAAELAWRDQLAGGVVDLDGARSHLVATGLEADPEVRSLVNARSHSGNARETHHHRQSQPRVGADDRRRSVPEVPAILNLDATLARATKTRASCRVQFEVTFDHIR